MGFDGIHKLDVSSSHDGHGKATALDTSHICQQPDLRMHIREFFLKKNDGENPVRILSEFVSYTSV